MIKGNAYQTVLKRALEGRCRGFYTEYWILLFKGHYVRFEGRLLVLPYGRYRHFRRCFHGTRGSRVSVLTNLAQWRRVINNNPMAVHIVKATAVNVYTKKQGSHSAECLLPENNYDKSETQPCRSTIPHPVHSLESISSPINQGVGLVVLVAYRGFVKSNHRVECLVSGRFHALMLNRWPTFLIVHVNSPQHFQQNRPNDHTRRKLNTSGARFDDDIKLGAGEIAPCFDV